MKIKQTMKQLVIGFFLVTGLVVTTAPIALADCGGVETSIISCDQKGKTECFDGKAVDKDGNCSDGSKPTVELEDTGAWGILLLAINVLSAGVGVIAVGGVVYASVLYTSAGGNPEQVKKAMGMITNVVIGVVAYAIMFSLLNFLIPGGLFNS